MSTFLPPAPFKRPKNTKNLSLAPASSSSSPAGPSQPPTGADDQFSLDAYVTQSTPRARTRPSPGHIDDDDLQRTLHGPVNPPPQTSGSEHTLPPQKVSKISKKKPLGLGIKPTRPAPDAPTRLGAGTTSLLPGHGGDGLGAEGEKLSPSGSYTSSGSGGGGGRSGREEMARELASLDIGGSSTANGSSSRSNRTRKISTGPDGEATSTSTSKEKERKKKPKRPPTSDDPSSSTAPFGSGSASGSGSGSKSKERPYPDLKNEDLKVIGELGAGNGGTVERVMYRDTGVMMAKKLVLIDAKPLIRKQILRELQIMHDCASPWIVTFYGAFLEDVRVAICMEAMDRGSLDSVYKTHGAIPIDKVGKVAEAVLEGLTYLYDEHRIIHRDIKPSNILLNSKGEIKICDFGVSGELINSIANTFVGTSTYMSPERIQGSNYSVKSDVWSLGISLIELALGRFPFSNDDDDDDDGGVESDDDSDLEEMRRASGVGAGGLLAVPKPREKKPKTKKAGGGGGGGVSLAGGGMTMSILDLLQHIVNEPAPRLNGHGGGGFPKEAEEFVDDCLRKEIGERKSPKELLKYPWIKNSTVTKADLEAWASTLA